MRRRRADEDVDVVAGRLALHRADANRRSAPERGVSDGEPPADLVDAMLLATVLLWALNVTATRYLAHARVAPARVLDASGYSRGDVALLRPSPGTASARSAIRLSRPRGCVAPSPVLLSRQPDLRSRPRAPRRPRRRSALVLGTTPVFAGAVRARWAGSSGRAGASGSRAAVSFVGVGADRGRLGRRRSRRASKGDALLAARRRATWAGYSVAIAPLMRRYSPFRISAIVLAVGCVPLVARRASRQLAAQSFSGLGGTVWLAFAYAVLGPLFLTNILWFTAIDRVGPSRAALFANLQPFLAALFAIAAPLGAPEPLGDRRRRRDRGGDRARARSGAPDAATVPVE